MFRFLEYILIAIYIAVLLVISHWIGQLAYSWMPSEATAEAQKVDSLFSLLVAIGAFIILGLVGMMVYSIIFFRAPPTDYSEGHPARGDIKLEVLWTATPTVLVLWIAFQSFNIYQQLNFFGLSQIVDLPTPLEVESAYASPPDNRIAQSQPASETIDVFAKQWEWSFRYPNNVTSNELHLVVDRSVRLVLRSQDVLHGFYVPEFRVKQDIIPSRTITFVFTPTREGKYQLRDSQFSGTYFALMNANVYVESPEERDRWLDGAAQNPTTESDAFGALRERIFAESTQPTKTLFNSGWETALPSRSPVVDRNSPQKAT